MQLSGRKVLLLLSPLILGFLSTKVVLANTVVNVESHAEGGSTAETHVESNINSRSTTNTTTTTTGKTDIVIECNGEKKEYHSDKAENVHLDCDNTTSGTAKTQVNINNSTNTQVTYPPKAKQSITPNPTIQQAKKEIDEQKEKIKQEVKSAKERVKEERKDLFEELTKMIRDLFKNLHF